MGLRVRSGAARATVPAATAPAGLVAAALAGLVAAALAGLIMAAPAAAQYETAGPTDASTKSRYTLVHGCFALRSAANGGYVTRTNGGYDTSASSPGAGERFRMQATTLGRYLLYGLDRDVVTANRLGLVTAQPKATDGADWTVTGSGDSFRITNKFIHRDLAVNGAGGLVAVPAGSSGSAGEFAFVEGSGCPDYPEVNINVEGPQSKRFPPFADSRGMVEAHMHHMAFEFLGGGAHCGRPWHKFGAPYALVDCPDHQPNGCAAILETAVSDGGCHDPVGWPTFVDWPRPRSLTHEQSYYRWVERAHRAGLRVFVQLNVENRVLCEIYPIKRNSCDEMDSVRLQIKRAYELQRYVDAQSGGPGKGWYQIVHNPWQARRAINKGKLAVILGMEVSEPFGCSKPAGVPACDAQDITAGIQELYDMGVRQMELINKFDNALAGVAGDSGSIGLMTNTGNFYSAGTFWDLESCEDPENHDRSPTAVEHNDDELTAAILNLASPPAPTPPVYGSGPHCNQAGLTDLGRHAIREMAKRGMIFDPDHMSVIARNQSLDLIDAMNYPGTVSSHSWSTPNALPRIYDDGGFVAPYAGDSEGFVDKWRAAKAAYNGQERYFGIGWGADQNGLGGQGGPRGTDVPNPVTYPFRSIDGSQIVGRQVSGERQYDINADGVAHYGMYPDWVQDLRMLAGNEIIDDLRKGADAYLSTWERAVGIRPRSCAPYRARFHRGGLGGRFRLGAGPVATLRRAGQPQARSWAYRYCVRNRPGRRAKRNVSVVFHPDRTAGMILSTERGHRAAGVRPGDRVRKLVRRWRRGLVRRMAPKIWIRPLGGGRRLVYVARRGRVKAVGVAKKKSSFNRRALRRHVGRSGLA